MSKPILYGFNGSTFVRTVRVLLETKGIDYDQVHVHVLEGEPKNPEHLARHPFGKVPVLDIDGLRIRETDAIVRYLEDAYPNPSFTPKDPKDRQRMNQAMALQGSYGYDALIMVAGYHLFPDFIGGQDDDVRKTALENSDKFLNLLLELKGDDDFIAGNDISLADLYLGPMITYIAATDDFDTVVHDQGLQDWWQRMQAYEAFTKTAPE